MNQKQREYAIGRVNAILKLKVEKVLKDNTVPAKSLTPDEQVELVRARKVKLKIEVGNLGRVYASLTEVFDFSKYITPAYVTDDGMKLKAKLEAKANRTRDMIMLGDAEEALRLLAEFEA